MRFYNFLLCFIQCWRNTWCASLNSFIIEELIRSSFLFQADVCIPVLQGGRVQRVQHPVRGQSSAGDCCRTREGPGANPWVWAAFNSAAEFSPGCPQPLQTHGGSAHWSQGGQSLGQNLHYTNLNCIGVYWFVWSCPFSCPDSIPNAGEPRVTEEKCWRLSDPGSHDRCRTSVSPLSDCSHCYPE